MNHGVVYCHLCSKVAWRIVGKLGFCGDHSKEAFEASAAENARHNHGKKWEDYRGATR
ncbi:MAG: hypothetical protein ACYCOU_25220 [Sulfobacillus sp.]